MDSLRGRYSDRDDYGDRDYDASDDDAGHEPPPSPVGQDERRMQVRAYNHWASLLGQRSFPSIEDLEPRNLPDFSPYSVLLDFSAGIEDPGIPFLGGRLAEECAADGDAIERLSDVPSRSLLSRITDHYMQILANQAPIGFEAEFVNVKGATILYRGILLPFSSDDDTIDFIYGVINWKELADQQTSDELLLEIDQALGASAEPAEDEAPLTAWADGPTDPVDATADDAEDETDDDVLDLSDPLDPIVDGPFDAPLGSGYADGFAGGRDPIDWPSPVFGTPEPDDEDGEPQAVQPLFGDNGLLAKKDKSGNRTGLLGGAILGSREPEPVAEDVAPPQDESPEPGHIHDVAEAPDAETHADGDWNADHDDSQDIPAARPANAGDMGLADWLASARELAQVAKGSEDRSRQALYAAIGRAFDFSLAARAEPDEFDALVADAGFAVQDRAPMTPVVKLVFGADYDKTRLTEYASALSHGHRLGLGQGALADFLAAAEGGIKGVVKLERALKRQENGKAVASREAPREAVARKLRKLDHRPLAEIDSAGEEFTLLVARRLPGGEIVLLGEVADDVPLLERAARKLTN